MLFRSSQPSPGHTAIDIGFVDRWQSIDNAAFRPTALNREALIREVYTFVGSGDHGGLYEWLKRVVLSCRFIQSGGDLTNIAITTMAMVIKMIEPEEVCEPTPVLTMDLYLVAVKSVEFFINVAGMLLIGWNLKQFQGKSYAVPENLIQLTMDGRKVDGVNGTVVPFAPTLEPAENTDPTITEKASQCPTHGIHELSLECQECCNRRSFILKTVKMTLIKEGKLPMKDDGEKTVMVYAKMASTPDNVKSFPTTQVVGRK